MDSHVLRPMITAFRLSPSFLVTAVVMSLKYFICTATKRWGTQCHRSRALPCPTLPDSLSTDDLRTSQPKQNLASKQGHTPGGRLQLVLMRPPQLSVKICGGGGGGGLEGGRREGVGYWQLGQGGGGCAQPTTITCIPQGGVWAHEGLRGMCAITAISCLCQEESLKGFKD